MSVYGRIAEIIIRRPMIVAAILVLAILLSFYGMTNVAMETGMSTYVKEDTERYNLLNHYTETYGSDSLIVLVEADDIYDPAVISYVDGLQEELATERYIKSTSSVAGMIKQANGGVVPTSTGEV
jgi:predicted RND superfamily exporter protein